MLTSDSYIGQWLPCKQGSLRHLILKEEIYRIYTRPENPTLGFGTGCDRWFETTKTRLSNIDYRNFELCPRCKKALALMAPLKGDNKANYILTRNGTIYCEPDVIVLRLSNTELSELLNEAELERWDLERAKKP